MDGRTGRHVALDDAIEAGWINVEYHDDAAPVAAAPRWGVEELALL